MILRVSHTLHYRYSAPVFPEPHIFRLRPRSDAARQTEQFDLSIFPRPAGRHDFLDAEGNVATCAWFDGLTDSLRVTSNLEVRMAAINPFTYLITDSGFLSLPVRYSGSEAAVLSLYQDEKGAEPEVKDFIAPLIKEVGRETVPFLALLNRTIAEEMTVQLRREGEPLPPSVVLQEKKGACRDLTVLFMACCRAVGIAARFVSGYHAEDREKDHELHAWAEVYLPGGGWTGYDPTLGIVAAEEHIPLAASYTPAGAAPVIGTYRGTDISTAMEFSVRVSRRNERV